MDLAAPTCTVKLAEDCAGLGTGFCICKRTAHKLNQKIVGGKRIHIDPVYMSESHPPLRKFLKHKWPLTKIVGDSVHGSDSRGDQLLGNDGDLDIYIAGGSCQPFSKQGKNTGRKDSRSNTTRDAVDFIKTRRPKSFIMEQVKNITSKTHKKWLDHRVLRVLKKITSYNGRKLYKVRTEIYDSAEFGTPQIRKRLYIIGVRKDIPSLRRFKMPTRGNGRPKSLASLVPTRMPTSGQQVEDWELTYTESRNWNGIRGQLEARSDVKFPVIGDFQQSKAFGLSLQERKCMTITKSRAQSRAFWIIDKCKDGSLTKRRLTVRDYAQLMGWDKKSQTQYLGIDQFHCPRNDSQPLPVRIKGVSYGSKLSQSQLLAALGNSFSVPVFQAIVEGLLRCFSGHPPSDSDSDSDSDNGGEPHEWEHYCPDKRKLPRPADDFHTPIKKRKIQERSFKHSGAMMFGGQPGLAKAGK